MFPGFAKAKTIREAVGKGPATGVVTAGHGLESGGVGLSV